MAIFANFFVRKKSNALISFQMGGGCHSLLWYIDGGCFYYKYFSNVFIILPLSFLCKDQSEKKVTNVDAYISVNFSHMIKNLVPQKMYILPAFQRGILCNCVFPIIGTRAILLKLIKNEMCIKFCKHYNQHF